MFEEQLYEREPVTTPLHQGDLFYDYEIKGWDLSSRIYKILGISALFNIFALLIFAQTSLLTMKGCDSPLVGRVCQVLDVVYVGSMLFGTERDYVDAVYDKTDLGDAEITYVDVSGITPPLSYPEGYFQIANPEQNFATLQSVDDMEFTSGIPGIPSGIPITKPGGGSLFDTTPNVTPPNPKPIEGDLPSGFGSSSPSPGIARNPIRKGRRGGRVTATPKPTPEEDVAVVDEDKDKDEQTADNKPPANTDQKPAPGDPSQYDINKRPFVDLADEINILLDRRLVKLESGFQVAAKGKLNDAGKFQSFEWAPTNRFDDPRMAEVLKRTIEALNDSGYLQYLKDLSGKDFNLLLQQDEVNITAVVQSEMENENRAKSISSGLNILIDAIRARKSGENADQNDKDDLLLLQNATVLTEGKKLQIRFMVPKDVALPMIQRKLAEQKAKPRTPPEPRPSVNTGK